jgi:septal ring factor EnvC (AmiA/AmiB activator)
MRNRYRHRYPPFFNLSLVDVICNALGAVIFLMFLSYWQASRVSSHLQAAHSRLNETQSQLEQLLGQLNLAQQNLQQKEQQLAQTQETLAKTEQARQQTLEQKELLQQQLRGERAMRQLLEMVSEDLAEQLHRSQQQAQQLAVKLQQAEHRLQSTDRQLQQMQQQLAEERRLAEKLRHTLASLHAESALLATRANDLDKQVRTLNEHLATLEKERRDLQNQATQLSASRDQAEQKVQQLQAELARLRSDLAMREKQLATLTETGHQLRKENDDLQQRLKLQRQENQRLSDLLVLADHQVAAGRKEAETLRAQLRQAEARFAGVDLSGRRAIFLVDTSGSMGKRDPQTDDPTKWPMVCETVRHVLASMPHLESFQVITFSSQVHYPLGKAGAWLPFDRDKSPQQVLQALQTIQPAGGTNLHAAFAEAFRYRPLGLDTIILFSDGLPTEAPDLTPQELALSNVERERLLAPRLLGAIRKWNTPQAPAAQADGGVRRVRIHAVGFYYDSPNLGNFLWSLVRENEGSFVGMNRP